MEGVSVRQMLATDIESAMRLKEAESWNQTEADWHFLLRHNPELCLVASLRNEVIGTVTAINYQNEVAWIGMMLVSSDHRRKGVSSALLKTIIERLKGCTCIKLDATPSGTPVYRRLGFEEEIELNRMSTEAICAAQEHSYKGSLERIASSDIAEMSRLDEQIFGASREELIKYLVDNLPQQSWVTRRYGRVTGFVLGRRGSRYTHLGPIMAESNEDARALVAQVSREREGEPILMDVPCQNKEWQLWLSELGFSGQRSFSRMFLRKNIRGERTDQLFAIGGPELG